MGKQIHNHSGRYPSVIGKISRQKINNDIKIWMTWF